MTTVTFLQETSLTDMYSLLQIAYPYGSLAEKAVRIGPIADVSDKKAGLQKTRETRTVKRNENLLTHKANQPLLLYENPRWAAQRMGTGFPLDEQQNKESSQVHPRLKQIEKDCLLYKDSQVRIGCHIYMPIVINDRGIHAEEMPGYQEDYSTKHQWQENEKIAPQRSARHEEPTHEQCRFHANDDKTDSTNSRPKKGTCEVHSYAPLMTRPDTQERQSILRDKVETLSLHIWT